MALSDQLNLFVKGAGPALAVIIIVAIGTWIRNVYVQKQRNVINEINFEGSKIKLNVDNTPIADLVATSNSGHGATEVVKPGGSDDTKG